MAALLNRDGRYYAQFYDENRDPQRKRFSLRTNRKRTARRRLTKLEDSYLEGAFDPWTDDPWSYDEEPQPRRRSLRSAKERFLSRKKKQGLKASSLRTYREVLRLLEQEIGGEIRVDDIQSSQIRAFLFENSLAKATRHKRFGHLRTFFRWAVKEDLISSNTLEAIDSPKKPQKLPKAVSREELRQICAALRADYQAKREKGWVEEGEMVWRIPLLWFALYTGMRGAELSRLRWRDIEEEKGLIYIREQKNNQEQTIPLNSKAREVLADVRPGEPKDFVFRSPGFQKRSRNDRCFRERASEAFREGRRIAGIERKITFHSLRHGFCTLLAEAGKPAYVIKAAARHADISTSMIYVHMANEHLKEELEDVFD